MQSQAKLLIAIILLGIIMIKCSSDNKNQSKSPGATVATVADSTNKSAATANDSLQQTTRAPLQTDSSQKITSDDWLLTPGVSAGKTVINSNADSVYKRLGTPDGGDAAMMKAVAIWYTNHDSTAHSTAIYTTRDAGKDPAARVKLIRVTSPTFKTKEGVGPSSSLINIKKTYSNLKKTETYKDAGKFYTIYDSPEGIAFEISQDKKCRAIIIHQSGKYFSGTYMKFR